MTSETLVQVLAALVAVQFVAFAATWIVMLRRLSDFSRAVRAMTTWLAGKSLIVADSWNRFDLIPGADGLNMRFSCTEEDEFRDEIVMPGSSSSGSPGPGGSGGANLTSTPADGRTSDASSRT